MRRLGPVRADLYEPIHQLRNNAIHSFKKKVLSNINEIYAEKDFPENLISTAAGRMI